MRRLVIAFSVRNRTRKAELITAYIRDHSVRTVILSGASASQTAPNEMIVERGLMDAATVVCGFDIAARSEMPWPTVIADGRELPFRDRAVDLVVSNAVVEHVGDETDQRAFVDEHLRVARHCIMTTPNRWFPVESHTSAVFRHWSSDWRSSRGEFTRLLSRREFTALLPADARVLGRPWSPTFVAFIDSGSTSG